MSTAAQHNRQKISIIGRSLHLGIASKLDKHVVQTKYGYMLQMEILGS